MHIRNVDNHPEYKVSNSEGYPLNFLHFLYICNAKAKLSLYQAVEAYRVVRRRVFHIF
jgi:hypothetical protein